MNLLNQLPRTTKKKKRFGRGISAGKGKSAGRGTKGQKSRSGFNIPSGFEGGQTRLYQRLPKLKGGRFKQRAKQQAVTTTQLNAYFVDNERVNLQTLKKKRLISKHALGAKIIGQDKLTKKLKFSQMHFSASVYKSLYGK